MSDDTTKVRKEANHFKYIGPGYKRGLKVIGIAKFIDPKNMGKAEATTLVKNHPSLARLWRGM